MYVKNFEVLITTAGGRRSKATFHTLEMAQEAASEAMRMKEQTGLTYLHIKMIRQDQVIICKKFE